MALHLGPRWRGAFAGDDGNLTLIRGDTRVFGVLEEPPERLASGDQVTLRVALEQDGVMAWAPLRGWIEADGPDLPVADGCLFVFVEECEPSLRGVLETVTLREVLTLVKAVDKPVAVTLEDAAGARGLLALRKGRVVHAQLGAAMGVTALRSLLALEEGTFQVYFDARTTQVSLDVSLAEALERRDVGAVATARVEASASWRLRAVGATADGLVSLSGSTDESSAAFGSSDRHPGTESSSWLSTSHADLSTQADRPASKQASARKEPTAAPGSVWDDPTDRIPGATRAVPRLPRSLLPSSMASRAPTVSGLSSGSWAETSPLPPR